MIMHRRICFIVASFSDGGVNKVVSNLANNFVDRGIHVDVVVLSSKFTQAKHLYAPKVNLITLSGSRSLSFLPLLRFFKNNSEYDAIISSVEFVNIHTIVAHKLAKLHSKLIVITHTDLVQEKIQKKITILKIVYKLARVLYPRTDKVCAVSNGVAKSIEEVLQYKEDVQVIYNPIVHSSDFNYIPKMAPHAWCNENTPVFVACGRLTKQKNFKMLIVAFQKLVKIQNVRLIILGDGEEKEELLQLVEKLNIKNNVYFAGNVENPLDYFYYSKALVATSLLEGFGNVLVEALSVGCPVISTNCPSGPAEILGNGQWGKLVSVNDEQELINALTGELADRKFSRMYLKNRAKDFNVKSIADQYLALIYPDKEAL